MPQIKKVLNSSVILVSDEQDKEYIILQKGIGYGGKPGQKVTVLDGSKVFVPVSPSDRSQLLKLLDEIPATYLEITQKTVQYAQQQLHTTLNEHIYLALTDHLHFAVERMKEHIVIANRVFWELKTFYPKEYDIGLYACRLVKEALDIELPVEEAANVAFHIANAQKDENSQYDAMRAAKLIGKIIMLVTYTMNCQPDKESLHYSRFISHLQYFAERFFADKMLASEDDFLYNQISAGYPRAITCAEKVRTLVLKEYDKLIPNEEVAYLAVHIQRLTTR